MQTELAADRGEDALEWRSPGCSGRRSRTGAQGSGRLAYHSGRTAEELVAGVYMRSGRPVAHRRWRGRGGEIDLIAREGDAVVFVEVKKARDFATAARALTLRQARRIMAAAEEFVANEPRGALTDMRFDVALVDAAGRVEIVENALSG